MLRAPERPQTRDSRWRAEASRRRGEAESFGPQYIAGFFIQIGFAQSIAATLGAGLAMTAFTTFYLVCVAATYTYYMRTRHEHVAVPSLAPRPERLKPPTPPGLR